MTFSKNTKELLAHITEASNNTLKRPMDLGALLEVSRQNDKQVVLEELAFISKFLIKTMEIIKRIGQNGEGYDKLYGEFSSNVVKSRELISSIIESAPIDVKTLFKSQYLFLNPTAMENIMKLYHDLSWYKNYLIDHRTNA
ncbi:MAG: hypothetical protein H3C35_13165 [Bacteroidetes bacterium]|nr:hypothetical protein [Bacteroidota bacterium]